MEFTATGVVIREKDSGENDKIITVLTKEHGKVTALARGIKKLGSKNNSGCQLFAYSEYDFSEKNGSITVKRAVLKEVFFGIRHDMERLALACYFADIINGITYENNTDDGILRLFLNTLYALSTLKDIAATKIKGGFEYKTMCLCGFEPILDYCAECSCEIDEATGKEFVFSLENGAVFCKECEKRLTSGGGAIPYTITISGSLLKTLVEITTLPVNRYLYFTLSEDVLSEFSFFCEKYLLYKTEKSFKTLKIYKDISNSLKI